MTIAVGRDNYYCYHYCRQGHSFLSGTKILTSALKKSRKFLIIAKNEVDSRIYGLLFSSI